MKTRHKVTAGVMTAGLTFLPACSGAPEAEPTSTSGTSNTAPACLTLNSLNYIGPSKSGGYNAKNTGECFGVYDPDTYKTLGQVASEGVFAIDCYRFKPTAFEVRLPGGVIGLVNLDRSALQEFAPEAHPDIPECPYPGQ